MAGKARTTETRTTSRAERLQQILDAVSGEIEPVPVTTGYRWATALVAFGMLLLPLIYAGIVFLCSWFVYWHATSNFRPLMMAGV